MMSLWKGNLMGLNSLRGAVVLLGLLAIGCGTKGDIGNSGGAGTAGVGEGGAGGGGDTVKFAVIETAPASVVVSDTGGVSPNTVVVTGTGEIDLQIYGFRVEGNAAYQLVEVRGCRVDGCTESWDAGATDLSNIASPIVIGLDGTPYSYVEVQVNYDPAADTSGSGAELIITNNADGNTQKSVSFATNEGEALIAVFPPEVDFGSVQAGDTPVKEVTIENLGADPLLISTIDFQGPSAFSLEIEGVKYDIGSHQLSPAFTIEGFGTASIFATFAPDNGDPATASVKLISNASNTETGGEEVILKGNNSGPKINVNPEVVNFGPNLVSQLSVLPIQILSTGTSQLVVTDIALAEGSNVAYQLDYSTLPGFEDGSKPSPENPLILDINQDAELQVRFTPETESAKDENNQAIPETAMVLIENNTFEPMKEVEVKGIGVSGNCPVAVIVIQEGEQVIPQTLLHLFGDQSFSPAGTINKWEWSVEQPSGSQSLFLPSSNFPNPTFEANVAGQYLFKLTVWDDNNTPSCVPDEAELVVIPDEAIHVELLWNTPNDPDQTDEGPEAGADLDLHFVHPYAGGPDLDGNGEPDGWFDQPFDCFWFNPSPQWASFDPAIDDDPGLDRDDTDGAGPENLNLNIPENDKTYVVGVHYWADHSFGPSYATVRVYIYADLVFQLEDVKLVNYDMWEVCTVDWPSGNVEQVEDGFKITPEYINPFFYQP